MAYEPPLTLTSKMLDLCSDISEMVGMLGSASELQKALYSIESSALKLSTRLSQLSRIA